MLAPRILIQEKDSVQIPGKIPAQLKQTLIYGWNYCPSSTRSNVYLRGHVTTVPREQSVIEGGVTFLLCSISSFRTRFCFPTKIHSDAQIRLIIPPQVSTELEMVVNLAYSAIPLQKLWEKGGDSPVENPWKHAENIRTAPNGKNLN